MRTGTKSRKTAIAIALAAGLFTGLVIGSRTTKLRETVSTLTAPKGASAELQASINKNRLINAIPRTPKQPTTEAQWREKIAFANKLNTAPIDRLEEYLKVTITPDAIDGVPVFRVRSNVNFSDNGTVFILLHGGGYVYYGGEASLGEAAIFASYTGIETINIDYRMPPDHPHPAAIEDVETVYRSLLQDYSPAQIGMGGTSAGGGLALAAVHQFKRQNLEVPGALFLGSPWVDLTKTGDTLSSFKGRDRVLSSYEDELIGPAELYANGKPLTDPLLSPVYGDFSGFPPAYLVSGTRDLLLSDTIRTHRKMKKAGVLTDLNIYEGMSHGEYLFVLNAPESVEVFTELTAFLNEHLAQETP